MQTEDFDEAYASFVTCDVADLSGLELGQFGWATMMTATDGNYSEAISAARELFERGARKGNVESVVMLAEFLYGDADLSLPAEPLKARCLEAVADRASPRDFAHTGAVRECLAERDCSLIDERLVFCPEVASPLTTELGKAMVLLGFTIQASGAVSDIRVIEERGDTRWTDEAIAALSQWQYVELAEPTSETHRFLMTFARD